MYFFIFQDITETTVYLRLTNILGKIYKSRKRRTKLDNLFALLSINIPNTQNINRVVLVTCSSLIHLK